MSTITLLCIALAGVIMLLLLVIKAKVQPFVALLLVSLLVALAAGIPAGEVGKVMIAGMGGVLGSVTIIKPQLRSHQIPHLHLNHELSAYSDS